VQRFVRDLRNFEIDQLPTGPFECCLRADGSEDQVTIWIKMIKRKHKNEANDLTPRERKRKLRILEKYKNVGKSLPDQEVITKIAVLQVLSRISGHDHFDHYLTSVSTIVRS
jgi:hypothetical protein